MTLQRPTPSSCGGWACSRRAPDSTDRREPVLRGRTKMALARLRTLGRRWTALGLTAVMTVSTAVVALDGSVARAADPATEQLATAMDRLSQVIAAGSALQQAAEAVPFTGVSPAMAGGLDMAQSLQGTLGELKNNVQNFVDQAPGDTQDALESLDTTVAGVAVTFGCDGPCDPGEQPVAVSSTAGVVTIDLPVTLTKTVASTPLAFDDVAHVLTLSGGA